MGFQLGIPPLKDCFQFCLSCNPNVHGYHGLKEKDNTISTRRHKRNNKKVTWNKCIQFLGQETAAMMEVTFKAYCIDARLDHRNLLIIWNQFHVGRNQYTEKI